MDEQLLGCVVHVHLSVLAMMHRRLGVLRVVTASALCECVTSAAA